MNVFASKTFILPEICSVGGRVTLIELAPPESAAMITVQYVTVDSKMIQNINNSEHNTNHQTRVTKQAQSSADAYNFNKRPR